AVVLVGLGLRAVVVGNQHGVVVDAVGLHGLRELELAVEVALVAEAVLQAGAGQAVALARFARDGGGGGAPAKVAAPVHGVGSVGSTKGGDGGGNQPQCRARASGSLH